LIEDEATSRSIKNSVVIALVGATVATIAATLITAGVVRTRSRALRAIDGAIRLPATLSNIILGVGFLLAFSGSPFHLGGSWTILLLAYLALYIPQALVSTEIAVSQVGTELDEAAAVCGARSWRRLLRVGLPLMKSGLAVAWALVFVRMVEDLTVSSLLAGSSNSVVGFRMLEVYQNGTYAEVAALAMVISAVVLVVLVPVFVIARRGGGVQVSSE
jgi:iron(III) transport system permease protein